MDGVGGRGMGAAGCAPGDLAASPLNPVVYP